MRSLWTAFAWENSCRRFNVTRRTLVLKTTSLLGQKTLSDRMQVLEFVPTL